MDGAVQITLEFDKIRTLLAEQAAFSGGKSLASALQPTVSLKEADRWQQETAEAVRMLEGIGPPPFGGLRDVRPVVRRAELGATLLAEQLVEIADTARASARLRSFLAEHATTADAVILSDLGGLLGFFKLLQAEINRCFDGEGHMVDHASPKLADIRVRLRTYRQRVRDHLDSLVRSSKAHRYLQEPIVTLRGGRYVVPVKQEYRAEMPGVVHDQSASGATLFVEPLPVVEINNDVRRGEREEEEEIQRILAYLSGLVADEAEEMVQTVEIAAELDFIFAKARLAAEWSATRPRLNESGRVDIRQGRHPLLQGDVVPIDVRLGGDFIALIITGPNTGGKTVTLKTVGLFALMAQAGLHLPAEDGSEIAVFRQIFADIGDEQSIEQNLSTFSSHMSHIVRILERVDSDSLVLLDELGAGTDPTEGAALAIALLERLLEVQCRAVATTHYSELKIFAYTHPAIQNASVEFDVQTLRPTYRLSIGLAGKSNAFAISSRLGLDRGIIERAQGQLTEDERKVDDLIQSVEADRRGAQRDRDEAAKLRRRYQELYDRYYEAFEKLKDSRSQVLEESKREARTLLQEAQREAEDLLGRLRKVGWSELEEEAGSVRRRLAHLAERAAGDKDDERSAAVQPSLRPLQDSPEPGMTVRIVSLGQEGEILHVLGDGKVVVQAGAMKVTVDLGDLEASRSKSDGQGKRSGYTSVSREKAEQVKTEVDLRGLVVDEALEQVDKYLDDAGLAGLDTVRLIHGKGTGALRNAVQHYVQDHPRVRDYRYGQPSEGGTGVTIVEL